MNYELAKQLKDAGFPQKEVFTAKEALEMSGQGLTVGAILEQPYIPTLEELIEACEPTKEDFALFCYPPSTWVAEYKNPHRSVSLGEATGEFRGEGLTPSEAVARLWLALHAKLTDTK